MRAKLKLMVLVVSVGIVGAAGTAYAADLKSPADIVAGLTGKAVTEVTADRVGGKTYGAIANEAGMLEQFKAEMLVQKKALLAQRVQDGSLTQQQADAVYEAIKANQAVCDGTGNAGIGRRYGTGFGSGAMMGQGRSPGFGGAGRGAGRGYGRGQF